MFFLRVCLKVLNGSAYDFGTLMFVMFIVVSFLVIFERLLFLLLIILLLYVLGVISYVLEGL